MALFYLKADLKGVFEQLRLLQLLLRVRHDDVDPGNVLDRKVRVDVRFAEEVNRRVNALLNHPGDRLDDLVPHGVEHDALSVRAVFRAARGPDLPHHGLRHLLVRDVNDVLVGLYLP